MVQTPDTLADIAAQFDAIVFDQWGVLHDGNAPYPGVPEVVRELSRTTRLAVLSNSGKRAGPNAERIAALGYRGVAFEAVMTSGEAFCRDVADQAVAYATFHAITAAPGDAEVLADGLPIRLVATLAGAEAVLLMGIPEGSDGARETELLDAALALGLPVCCTNPDLVSPRADGRLQLSPGTLARRYEAMGGTVVWYGKPHVAIFRTLERVLGLPPHRLLMVGDSLGHDVLGAKSAGWSALFVQSGNHRDSFRDVSNAAPVVARLCADESVPLPDYTMARVA